MNEQGLIVFAKAPIAGKTKTRLIPAIGPSGAARIHEELVLRTLEGISSGSSNEWLTTLWCSPDRHHFFFQNLVRQFDLQLAEQRGKTLGEKMLNAFQATLQHVQRALIIGTDCPVLNGNVIRQAFSALLNNYEAVIIPAEDGGYISLGLTRVDARLFKDIAWGTNTVYEQTISHLQRLDFNYLVLPPLWDIDRPEDLARYHKLIKAAK